MFKEFKSNCLNCDTELVTFEEHKLKKYCNDSCRHKHKRKLKNPIPISKPKKEIIKLNWMFEGKPFTINNTTYYGFIYRVIQKSTCIDYIGKKSFITEKEGNIEESNWATYLTSSKELQSLIKENPNDFEATILQFAVTPKQLSFLEYRWQEQYDVFNSDSFNKKWYGKKKYYKYR